MMCALTFGVWGLSLLFQGSELERARLLADSGRVREAIHLLENRPPASKTAPELALLAQLYAATGGLPQAVTSLGEALDLAPEQVGLRITRGAMLFELTRYDEARKELERVLRESPRAGLAHYYLAAVERATGKLSDAETSAATAVSLVPEEARAPLDSEEYDPHTAALHLLAEIRFARGANPEELLRAVLLREPQHPSAHYLLARALLSRGRKEEADAELLRFRAIKRAEEHLASGRELARVPGRRREAIVELRLAAEACPDHARALFLLGKELALDGERGEARAALERALILRPAARPEIEKILREIE
jgi:tetratricopeptide (TPR) repeat protein